MWPTAYFEIIRKRNNLVNNIRLPPPLDPWISEAGVCKWTLQRGTGHWLQHSLPCLHQLISASISRWMTFDPAEFAIFPGRKYCALVLLNIIPKFTKEKHQFLSDLSSKSNISMCSICMITKEYKVFFWNLCQSENVFVLCDESPPKRWTVAETFAWRLLSPMNESVGQWPLSLRKLTQD